MSYAKPVRVLLDCLAIVGVFFCPWWVTAVCMLALAVAYPAWEVILIGLIMDLMWLPGSFFSHVPLFTIAGVGMVWLFEPMRSQFYFGLGR